MGDVSVVYVYGNELLAKGANLNTLAYTTGNNLWIAGQSTDSGINFGTTWKKVVINPHIYGFDNMPVFWLISVNGYLVLMSYDLWYSQDNGLSWYKSQNFIPNQFGNNNAVVHIAKAAINNADVLYSTPLNFQRSLTSGVSWSKCNIIRPAAGAFSPKVRGFTYNKDTLEYIIAVDSYLADGAVSLELSSPIFKSTDGINFTNFGSGEGLTAHNDIFGNSAGKYIGSLLYDNGTYFMTAPEEIGTDGQPQNARIYYTSIDLNLWQRHETSTVTINGNAANTPAYTQIGMIGGSLYTLPVTDDEAGITDNYIVSNKVPGQGFSLIINHTYVVPQIMPVLERTVSGATIVDLLIQTISKAHGYYFWIQNHYDDITTGQIDYSTIYASPQLDLLYNDIAYKVTADISTVEVKTAHLSDVYFIEKIPNTSGGFYHSLSKLVSA